MPRLHSHWTWNEKDFHGPYTAPRYQLFSALIWGTVSSSLCVLPATADSGCNVIREASAVSRKWEATVASSQLMKIVRLWSSLQLMKVHSCTSVSLVVVTNYITKVGQLRLKCIICSFICGVWDEHQIEVLASKALWSTKRKSGLRNTRWGFLRSYWRP